jgi:glycosyltransferase involved in cell wall biosynthesis
MAAAADIAVVIPTRNRRAVLPRAVDSVFGQHHQNFELIVVDDCSEDDTTAYLSSITDPRLKWHRFDQWRRGNAARNHGVAMSQAPLVSFLDSDDTYLPDRLGAAVAFFASHPEVDLRLHSFMSVVGSRQVPCVNPDAILNQEDLERYLIGYCLNLGGSGITTRRQAFDEIGGFDVTILRMQDREFLLRAARTRGCALAASLDWVKNRSGDSLSHQPVGQIDALAVLSDRHSALRDRYPELFGYLVAREILQPVLGRRLRDAKAALDEARRNTQTRLSNWRLLTDYVHGKRTRRNLRKEMFERFGG